ncbi:nucleoside diphosphate kinase 3 isoform X1 [Manis javanica]|uniref:nucleoside diphosphate kinase 3 isoform X1 n=1 Tax=Manis javanica TaxID=9974 RepID=UPI003C6CF36E
MICLVLTVLANLFPAACAGEHERTFLAVKPDGVQRRLVGEIVRRFERKGFKLVALKLVQVRRGGAGAGTGGEARGTPALAALPHPQASEELLREHYAELRERPFYSRLVKYMGSGPVVAMADPCPQGAAARVHAPLPQERDSRQRLGGERPPRDRALVPQRRAPVLGGQHRALAVRVGPTSGPRKALPAGTRTPLQGFQERRQCPPGRPRPDKHLAAYPGTTWSGITFHNKLEKKPKPSVLVSLGPGDTEIRC